MRSLRKCGTSGLGRRWSERYHRWGAGTRQRLHGRVCRTPFSGASTRDPVPARRTGRRVADSRTAPAVGNRCDRRRRSRIAAIGGTGRHDFHAGLGRQTRRRPAPAVRCLARPAAPRRSCPGADHSPRSPSRAPVPGAAAPTAAVAAVPWEATPSAPKPVTVCASAGAVPAVPGPVGGRERGRPPALRGRGEPGGGGPASYRSRRAADSPLVAVVNRTQAERLWPGRPSDRVSFQHNPCAACIKPLRSTRIGGPDSARRRRL